jgi:hypothetical protein
LLGIINGDVLKSLISNAAVFLMNFFMIKLKRSEFRIAKKQWADTCSKIGVNLDAPASKTHLGCNFAFNDV